MPAAPESPIVSQAELCRLFNTTPQTVLAWEGRGCPIVQKGGRGKPSRYRVSEVIRWREEQAALAATGDLAAMDMEEAKRRKLAAEAALAELDLAVRRNEYVLIEEVAETVAAEYSDVRANFTSMPGDIAADLEGLATIEIQELLAAKVSEILTALSADETYPNNEETDHA